MSELTWQVMVDTMKKVSETHTVKSDDWIVNEEIVRRMLLSKSCECCGEKGTSRLNENLCEDCITKEKVGDLCD